MLAILKQAAGTALGVLIGLAAGAAMYAHAAPKQEQPNVIRAQKCELVDEQGDVVGSFEAARAKDAEANRPNTEAGQPTLMLRSPSNARLAREAAADANSANMPRSGSTILLTCSSDGKALIGADGTRFNGAHQGKGYSHSSLFGLVGNDAIPTVKLSMDDQHKWEHTAKP
jgi:hypothetical protein